MRRLLAVLAAAALAGCVAPAPEPPTETSSTVLERPDRERCQRKRHHRRSWRRCQPPSTTTTTRPPTTTSSTTTTSTTTTTTPGGVTPNGPAGVGRLVFSDEFNGTTLDTSKWRPNWLAGSDTAVTPPINTAELSCYDPGHVSVSGGFLRLTADRNTPSGCRTRSGTAQYASGMVQTNSDFRFTYGYVEARMFLPGSNGRPENWPAFWTNGQSWPRDGEIDVMEALGGEPRWHYHYESGGQHRSVGSGFNLISPKTGWHTFGAHWRPGRIDFYYDGRHVGSVTSGVTSSPHYIVVNMALSSSISPPVVVPSTLLVDYVRAWAP